MTVLSYLAAPLVHPIGLAMIALGTFLGIYIGAIPGLSDRKSVV